MISLLLRYYNIWWHLISIINISSKKFGLHHILWKHIHVHDMCKHIHVQSQYGQNPRSFVKQLKLFPSKKEHNVWNIIKKLYKAEIVSCSRKWSKHGYFFETGSWCKPDLIQTTQFILSLFTCDITLFENLVPILP